MGNIKLLIADGTEEFRLALGEALGAEYELQSCWSGKEALALLQDYRPDVLVLDLMLPELDGISLLQAAADAHITPLVLATTRYISDYLLEALDHFGVGYLMVKPCDVQATVSRISDMTQRLHPCAPSEPDPKASVSRLLHALGISSKRDGYDYLLEAVPYFARHPGSSITKELYPAVAALCGSKATQVERSIRSAIQTAWLHREDVVWASYFTPRQEGRVPRPTNAEFISRLAEAARIP